MSVQGVHQLRDKLTGLEGKVAKKIVRKGLRAGAKLTLSAERGDVPKVSGLLEQSLKVRAGGTRNGTTHVVVGTSKKWFTGPAFYGAFIEFGHKIGSRRLGDARKMQPANPFAERAYNATKDAALDASLQAMWQAYKDEVGN